MRWTSITSVQKATLRLGLITLGSTLGMALGMLAVFNLAAHLFMSTESFSNFQNGFRAGGALTCILAPAGVVGMYAGREFLRLSLQMGLSRKEQFVGGSLSQMVMSLIIAAIATGGREAERLTHGWGIELHFFDVNMIEALSGHHLFAGFFFTALALSFLVSSITVAVGRWGMKAFYWTASMVFLLSITVVFLFTLHPQIGPDVLRIASENNGTWSWAALIALVAFFASIHGSILSTFELR